MSQTKTIPASACLLHFSQEKGNLQVNFSEHLDEDDKDEEGKPKVTRRFTMLAHTGAPVQERFFGNMILDLDTLDLSRQSMGILREHDTSRIVGFTDKIERTPKGIQMEGVVSGSTKDGIEVGNLSQEGFPWQASLGILPGSIEEVLPGQSVKVNGIEFNGPGVIFRNSKLGESSFTVAGADQDTSAAVLAAGGKTIEVEYTEGPTMDLDLNKLKSEHPELVEQLKAELAATTPTPPAPAPQPATTPAPVVPTPPVAKLSGEDITAILAESFTLKLSMEDTMKVVGKATTLAEGVGMLKDIRIAANAEDAKPPAGTSTGAAQELDAAQLAAMPGDQRCEYIWLKDPTVRLSFKELDYYKAYEKAKARGLLDHTRNVPA